MATEYECKPAACVLMPRACENATPNKRGVVLYCTQSQWFMSSVY